MIFDKEFLEQATIHIQLSFNKNATCYQVIHLHGKDAVKFVEDYFPDLLEKGL